jgi:hypothetical protein
MVFPVVFKAGLSRVAGYLGFEVVAKWQRHAGAVLVRKSKPTVDSSNFY